jgi:chromosomal replication initiator protein
MHGGRGPAGTADMCQGLINFMNNAAGEVVVSEKMTNPWEQAQAHLRGALDDHIYKNWFQQTSFGSVVDGVLTVNVPSQFFANWLQEHYLDTVCDSLRRVLPEFREVRFVPLAEAQPAAGDRGEARAIQPAKARAGRVRQSFSGLNPRYTFESFVVGPSNNFAHAASLAVSQSPARAYNPLFMYGGVGLGKTHLMHAIGNYAGLKPGARIAYMSSEEFTNQYIDALTNHSLVQFRKKYRSVDVLLIDDMQFLGGKERIQEEFFHTFNALFDSHKQIVMTCDRPAGEIPGLEQRLVSRFEWGLVTDIQPPDLETRIAILQNKAREENLTVSMDVLRYIATYINTNIRELEGALTTVLAFSRLTGEKIGVPLAETVLRDLIGSEKIRPVTIEQVQRAVAEHFDVRIADLRGQNRQRQIVQPRQIAMYLCKTLIPSLSLNDVGTAFGGKDHTTVLYACDRITKERETNPVLRQTLEQLSKSIRS